MTSLHDGVVVSVDSRVDANREEVLVVGCEDARGDDGAVRSSLAGENEAGREDSSGARLEVESSGLVELPRENVFLSETRARLAKAPLPRARWTRTHVVGDGDDSFWREA